eukprot:g437.t1
MGDTMSMSSSSSRLKKFECCQICPNKFYLDLELGEYTSHVKREIYDNFLEWHVEIHRGMNDDDDGVVSKAASDDDVQDHASAFVENSSRRRLEIPPDETKGEVGTTFYSFLEQEPFQEPIKSIDEVLNYGPCCELCPELFYPRPPRDINKKPTMAEMTGVGGIIAFVEEEEDVNVDEGARQLDTSETASSLTSDDGEAHAGILLEENARYAGYMPQLGNEGLAKGSKCCPICPSQFFAPMSYTSLSRTTKPKPKLGMFASLFSSEPTCCHTCSEQMLETSVLELNGKDPDEPILSIPHKVELAQQNLDQLSVPKNPTNRRQYALQKDSWI